MVKSLTRLLFSAGALVCALAQGALAQQLVLDEEFSHACESLTTALRPSLAPGTPVHYVLVADDGINAFVDQENVIHVNSGLILKAKSAGELQGVLAHELGHVAAHHVFQNIDAVKSVSIGSLAGAALGMGAAALGAPQVGVAIAMGGQAGGISSYLAHTRTQEAEADKLAIQALHEADISAKGMVGMFTTLRLESQLSSKAPPPWLVTHPLPPERLAVLTHEVQQESAQYTAGLAKVNAFDFERLKAKVAAITSTPVSVLRRYQGPSEAARYARAIAYTRSGAFELAERSITPLITQHPHDLYYKEVQGQIALQKGDLGTANRIYAHLVEANPGAILFRLQWADILRAQGAYKDALPQYQSVTRQWPEWDEPWYSLGLTYGNLGRLPESHLALTEANVIGGNKKAAQQSLDLANHYIKQDPKMREDVKVWAETLASRIKDMPGDMAP
jgi:predicted Zn-dependent protease